MSAKSARPNRWNNHKRRHLFSWLFTGGLAFGLTTGAQACDLALTRTPSAVVIDYNPFAVGPSAGALDLGLKNQGDAECDLRLSFIDEAGVPAASLALGGVGVQFRPRESSGLRTSELEPGVFRYTLSGQASGDAQLDTAIVVDAVPDAGTYAADLKLLIQDEEGKLLVPPLPVRVQLVSTPRAQLNLAGAAGAFGSGSSVEVVDFGDAVTGATRRIFVQVRANAPSTLSISSEHRGVMRRLGDVETPSNVPYTVELQGDPVDLSAPWTKAIDPPRTLAGASLPMLFTLGAVSGQMAGKYQDVLTIDISPH